MIRQWWQRLRTRDIVSWLQLGICCSGLSFAASCIAFIELLVQGR